MHKVSNMNKLVFSSPSKAIVKIEKVASNLRLVQKSNRYFKLRLEEQREKNGIKVKTEHCVELFDEKAEVEVEIILNSKEETIAGKDLLSRLLWN